jgi:heat shock protein 90kDa beta
MKFQDVTKKGLRYGDEDKEAEAAALEKFKEEYKPLVEFFVNSTKEAVKDGMSTFFFSSLLASLTPT